MDKLEIVTELISAFIIGNTSSYEMNKEFRSRIIKLAFEIADEIEEFDSQRKMEKNEKDPEWQMYNTGTETVERIMKLKGIFDLESELRSSTLNLPEEYRIKCYRHMHALFSNVMLNRIGEFGKEGYERAHQAKITIGNIIHVKDI
jgi:hypothetical protein